MSLYRKIFEGLPQPVGAASAYEYLDEVLPPIWSAAYKTKGGSLAEVTLGGDRGDQGAFTYLFDVQPNGSATDGRVIGAWGISKSEAAGTRDKARIAGLGGGDWSLHHPGRDRGHIFAHTMGGGMDINLFPQLSSVNRAGEWRRMERYAAAHPGTFCFVRPIYRNASWTPAQVEYGIYKLPPADAPGFWFNLFSN